MRPFPLHMGFGSASLRSPAYLRRLFSDSLHPSCHLARTCSFGRGNLLCFQSLSASLRLPVLSPSSLVRLASPVVPPRTHVIVRARNLLFQSLAASLRLPVLSPSSLVRLASPVVPPRTHVLVRARNLLFNRLSASLRLPVFIPSSLVRLASPVVPPRTHVVVRARNLLSIACRHRFACRFYPRRLVSGY
jgi:hypothetical protein